MIDPSMKSLDAQIAEFLGWQDVHLALDGWYYGRLPNEDRAAYFFHVPCFSYNMKEAIELLDQFNLSLVCHQGRWHCGQFGDRLGDEGYLDAGVIDEIGAGIAETIPLAIALAVVALMNQPKPKHHETAAV